MAHRLQCFSVVACLLAARYVAAQDILGKLFSTDAFWSCTKKEVFHSHLQRMFQVEAESEEPEGLESCSPAALTQLNKCMAKYANGSRSTNVSPVKLPSENGTAVAKCMGSDCPGSPTSGSKAPTGGQSSSSDPQAPAQRAATYGPMSQGAFARMVQRKRASLRAELQKAGLLTAELDAFLRGARGGEAKDAFGIPLPVGPKSPHPSADFEMRFAPQAPATDPATATNAASSSATTTTDATATRTEKSSAASNDFEMRFEPPTPEPDPNSNVLSELEAFIAASPAAQDAVQEHASSTISGPVRQEKLAVEEEEHTSTTTAQSGGSGPTLPPMGEQEAARLAAQQAANAAAREAALARKRQMARDEQEAAAAASGGKKAKRGSGLNPSATGASSTATASVGSPAAHRVRASSQSQLQQQQQQAGQRLRAGSSFATSASAAVKGAKHAAAAASLGKHAYMLVALLVVASAVGLFVAAAVMEDALLGRHSSLKAGGGDWLVLTRGLLRRCRRAFSAARKQLTGHGSDLPLSANEGTGPLARAVAAASAFVHVFWSHLADHRGQHIGGAVTAALDASRRASAGGFTVAPDRTSTGGACAYSTSASCFASDATPFAAPQYQRRRM